MIAAAYIKLAKRETVLCLSMMVSPVESNQVTGYTLVGGMHYLEFQPCNHILAKIQKPLVSHKIPTKSNMDILQSLVGIVFC